MTATNAEKLRKEAKKFASSTQDMLKVGQGLLVRGEFKEARLKFRLALLYNPRLVSRIALFYESILEERPENMNARLSLADLYLYLGDIDSAVGELEEMLDISPERADAYNILGKLYIKQGDIDSAIMLLEAAFRSGIKETSLVEMLAGAYIEKGRINEAISLYQGLLAKDGSNIGYSRILGELLARVDMPADAAFSFYSMLKIDLSSVSEVMYKLEDLKKKFPENIAVKELLADTYVKAVKPSLAASELENILNMDPSRSDDLIVKFKEILDKYPDEPFTLKVLAKVLTSKQLYSEAVAEYCKLMKFSNQYVDDAIAGFRDILSRFPGQVHAHEALGDAYLRLGRIEEALLEYIEVLRLNASAAGSVIEKCLKLSKENPNMILVHQVLGQAYVAAGEGASALEEAEFMIYLDKNYSPAHQIMGDAHMKMGNYAKAQNSYATAMNIDPYNIIIHGKYAEASTAIINSDIDNLKKRIEEDPWRLGTHLDIAKLYLMVQDFEHGVKELQTAVKDTARAPFAYNLLGQAFVELGRFDLAVVQFERALEVMPKELGDAGKNFRFNLGAAYEAIGNIAAAIAQYEIILSEDMEFGNLQGRIKNLANINPESQRNKLIAAVIEKFGENGMIGMWGHDFRRTEIAGDALSISFGQEHNSAGFEHFIKNRLKAAAEEFSLAVQLDPKFCAALNNLSVMHMKDGHLEQAETRLNLALSMDPGSAIIHNNMGVYHYLKKDFEGAIAEFNKALEVDPNFSPSYINLGDVMYARSSAQNAISLWEKMKSDDPLSAIATRRLAYKTLKN